MNSSPVVDDTLEPDINCRAPPVSFGDPNVLSPVAIVMLPEFIPDVPVRIDTLPATPELEDPVKNTTDPDDPTSDKPVSMRTSPELPRLELIARERS